MSYDIPYMWSLERNDTNELTYKTETHSVRERTYDCQGEGIVREFGGEWVHTITTLFVNQLYPNAK